MKMFYTIFTVGIAATLLISSRLFLNQITVELHPLDFINNLAKYQIFAMLISVLITIIILFLHPSTKVLLSIGKVRTIAEKEKWLGINGNSLWTMNGLQLLFFISFATGIFMVTGLSHTDSLGNFQFWFIPYILLFSLTNSLAEELIFRFSVIGGLQNHHSKATILIISAVLFGLPHYWGNPSGFLGVIMSGMLGYILCKATIETRGME
jgi:uncharacterized protein